MGGTGGKINKDENGIDPKSFEENGLVQPIFENGRFKNPFDTFEERTLTDVFKMIRSEDNSKIPWKNKEELDRTLPVVTPDFEKLRNPPNGNVQLMWAGHASILVQFDGLTVLTDPIWGDRCGPLGIMGPKRYRPPPCKIEDIPHVDAVVISHNHYDHLNHESVVKLNRKFGDKLHWFVAIGQADWMRQCGCKNVVELTWWQEHTLAKDGKQYMFAATPAQHWCKRTISDTNKALWCSWVVKGPKHSFYFAGDTGYCCAFKQIGNKYGPFSLSAIPIGAYEPRWFMRPQHVNPEEAVIMHEELKSEKSVGIHWGTFRLTTEHYMEPKQKLSDIVKEKGLDSGCFFTVKHGEVVTLTDEHVTS
ncbi:N-acyl-phosphatidylethanolamine-hydrolyzing phospholipase D-like [Ruditapes philippinarum]|uniref:N-acyl-phosphatidylethanolamine-hydrolyzing phospholipase D-like n=1 Tax=Ruditapes philippinarum TaxID=129788 RepID=UPI00295BD505|nr:N-acyl-phosphatidylethanolamine-hydrolyzing phospholipase D-like [Ruditapes philippinarum]